MNDKSQVKSDLVDWNTKMTEQSREVFINAGRKLLAEISTLQSQLTQAQSDNGRLKEADWQIEHAVLKMIANRVCDATQDAQHTNEGVCEGVDRVCKERDEAVAACAVMRCRLEELLEVHDFIDNEAHHQTIATQAALSTSAGKSFLERMKEAEWLLSRPLLTTMSLESELTEWRRRHKAFLKGGVK